MSGRRMVNPKLLLIMLGVALVTFSAIAIFMAVSYAPSTSVTPSTPSPMATTSAR